MTTGGCQICGCELYAARQCVMKVSLPDEKLSLVPANCYKHHWEAIALANGTYKGKMLPPPHAQSVADDRGEFEQTDHSLPLPDADQLRVSLRQEKKKTS